MTKKTDDELQSLANEIGCVIISDDGFPLKPDSMSGPEGFWVIQRAAQSCAEAFVEANKEVLGELEWFKANHRRMCRRLNVMRAQRNEAMSKRSAPEIDDMRRGS